MSHKNLLNPKWLNALSEDLSTENFDLICAEILHHQYRCNESYRRFCETFSKKIVLSSQWEAFPAFPVTGFRNRVVTCFPSEEACLVFETSGTTSSQRGSHYLQVPDYYERSLEEGFKRALPDLVNHRWISLIPPFARQPRSSLAYMITCLAQKIPLHSLRTFCDGDFRIDFQECLNAFRGSEAPVALFSTSFALLQMLEFMREKGEKHRLPQDSILFETGGYKGKTRELAREELYELLREYLGLDSAQVWNEYGMTELGSQCYARGDEGIHRPPPWLRVVIVDPATGQKCAPGRPGLLHFYDLANVDSVVAVATQDSGVYVDDGFRLLGRAVSAPLRGCSLSYA